MLSKFIMAVVVINERCDSNRSRVFAVGRDPSRNHVSRKERGTSHQRVMTGVFCVRRNEGRRCDSDRVAVFYVLEIKGKASLPGPAVGGDV